MYEQNGTMHPDFYSVHDATHDWFTDWNIEAQYTYFDGSPGGFFLSAIDGRPAPGEKAYWQLLVRGEPSEVGMSDLPAAGLGNLTWALTPY